MVKPLKLGVAIMALTLSSLAGPSAAIAGTRDFTSFGYALPADKPVTIVLMRPDVQVGQLQVGGLVQPNADWTEAARNNLAVALAENQRRRGIGFKVMAEPGDEMRQYIADYEALHRTVISAALNNVYGAKLPTKKYRDGQKLKAGQHVWDWTLGPGTQKIGDLTGGTYGLFLFTRDNFSTDARKAMQVAGILGCVVGFCSIVTGGQHVGYVSLVELSSGNIVWFNILRGSKGDIRDPAGAQAMVDAIMSSMPTKPGEGRK